MTEGFWYVALFASVFAAFLCGVLLGQLMKAGSVVKYLLRNKG